MRQKHQVKREPVKDTDGTGQETGGISQHPWGYPTELMPLCFPIVQLQACEWQVSGWGQESRTTGILRHPDHGDAQATPLQWMVRSGRLDSAGSSKDMPSSLKLGLLPNELGSHVHSNSGHTANPITTKVSLSLFPQCITRCSILGYSALNLIDSIHADFLQLWQVPADRCLLNRGCYHGSYKDGLRTWVGAILLWDKIVSC